MLSSAALPRATRTPAVQLLLAAAGLLPAAALHPCIAPSLHPPAGAFPFSHPPSPAHPPSPPTILFALHGQAVEGDGAQQRLEVRELQAAGRWEGAAGKQHNTCGLKKLHFGSPKKTI